MYVLRLMFVVIRTLLFLVYVIDLLHLCLGTLCLIACGCEWLIYENLFVAVFVNRSCLLFIGSENNSMYIYFKGLSKHLLTFKFDTVRCVLV